MHARLSQISLLLEQRRDAYNEHNFSMSGGSEICTRELHLAKVGPTKPALNAKIPSAFCVICFVIRT